MFKITNGKGFHVTFPEYVDTVQGWQSPLDVLRLMGWAAAQPAPASTYTAEGQ